MATAIKMPKMGMSMSEGELTRWLKEDGASVEHGEAIVEIESDKITNVVEAPSAGILHRRGTEGETYPVGVVLGYVAAEEEAVPEADGEPAPAAEPAAAEEAKPEPAAAPPKKEFVLASPIARRLAREHSIELADVEGTGPDSRVTEADVRAYLDAQKAVKISPVARKLADDAGLDVTTLTGTGPQGRITRQDVEEALAAREEAPAAPEAGVPLTGMRRTIAQRMTESLQTMAQVTVFTEVDVTELVTLRERLKRDFDLSYTDIIIQAAARALEKHRNVNVSLVDGELVEHAEIHVGMAVALDDGLIVPVIRNANRKSLREIAQETRDLAQRARDGTLDPDEVTGSTFSVTNLGTYGIDGFTPIINPPEAAILGVGRIIEKPAAYRGAIALRQMLVLSLTFDHRIVDGAPASAFLHTLAEMLTTPYLLSAD